MIKIQVGTIARQFGLTSSRLSDSLERLSSGRRINKASDDPSGFSFASRVKSSIGGLNTSLSNARDGVTKTQAADSALGDISKDLTRMQELATQYQSDTYSDDQKGGIKEEFEQLAKNIDRTLSNTEHQGHRLLAGDGDEKIEITHAGGAMKTEVSVDTSALRNLTLDDTDIDASVKALETAATTVSEKRAKLGALQERLEGSIENLDVQTQAGEATYSRVADANAAMEMANFVREQTLLQAGIALFAHGQMNSGSMLDLME